MKKEPAISVATVTRRRRRFTTSVGVAAAVALILVASLVSFAVAATSGFPDVPATHPYYGAINDLAGRGIIQGFANGDFGPAEDVKRQQFAKMIVLAGGYPVSEADVCPFTDVQTGGASTLYPDNFIAVCAAQGITAGKTATTFDPYASITRYQVISMVVRAADDLQPSLLASPPTGWTSGAGWAADATHGANAARAEYNGLLAGLDLATLNPHGTMSRGEVAQVLSNLLAKLVPPATTTTVAPTTTTTEAATTTTTEAVTTTTIAGTTSTTVTPAVSVNTYYSTAGLEDAQVVVTVLDQFGNPFPGIEVILNSTALEGSGLSLLTSQSAGTTDEYGNVAYSWAEDAGDWGVERVTAWLDDGTSDGLSSVVAMIYWIYDDRSTNHVAATAGQHKVNIASNYGLWDGLVLRAYLNPGAPSLGSATYVSSAGVSLSTNTHTWVTGEAFYVGAASTNTDDKPNWMYNVVP